MVQIQLVELEDPEVAEVHVQLEHQAHLMKVLLEEMEHQEMQPEAAVVQVHREQAVHHLVKQVTEEMV